MAAMIKIFISLLLFISFCTILVSGDDKCAYTRCGKEEPQVEFPFTLEGHQDKSCGYPGFNLSCHSETNRTLINLGTSGKFLVRAINYITQEVQIYDQDNCLPKRLMNLDLTGTPFNGYNYLNFNFYNCSSNFSSNFLDSISCLSTPNNSVYAAPSFGSRGRFIFGTCEIFATVSVPLSDVYGRGRFYLTDLNADLNLRWEDPNCGVCIQQGGTCKFENRSKNEIGCYNLPKRGLSKTTKYGLALGLGVPGLAFVLLIAGYFHRRFKSYNGNRFRLSELSSSVLPQPPIFIVGLDESVIQSYPKVVLGESRRLVKPEDNICSICLSEYKANDILKTIPDCKHCFHAACIDQWLRRNVTCPLCRNAPSPKPKPAPVPVSVPPPPPESHPV